MTTSKLGRSRSAPATVQKTPAGQPRLPVHELIETTTSMLRAMPRDYAAIETIQDALEAALPPPPDVTLRFHILWDSPAKTTDLEYVLEAMRETGAAMVVKVEQVS